MAKSSGETGPTSRRRTLIGHLLFGLLAAGWFLSPVRASAQPPAADTKTLGRFLTLDSPITDDVIGWVRQSAQSLQTQATQEGKKACLVLEVPSGVSQFHHVYGLADLLTTQPISNIKTIAWVPETVTGPNALIALACDEICLHPDAQLGDLGRGKALPDDQQIIVKSVVAKRHNAKVNEALAMALMNPQASLVQLSVEVRPGEVEKRLVTDDEARRLRETGVTIRDAKTLKDRGSPGVFSGAQARHDDILIMQLANSRKELADQYGLGTESLRETPRQTADASRPTLIEVQGVIEHELSAFLKRQIGRAVESGAKTIIFEITSPGGLLYDSIDLATAIADLDKEGIRTIAYIPKEAISGAAIIALGCDEIYLELNAKIGDAGPIEIQDGGMFARAPEKILSYLKLSLQQLAERKKRPAAVAMAMCDKDLDVFEVVHTTKGTRWFMSEEEIRVADGDWTQGKIVSEARGNLLLTVGGQRAYELLIAEPPVKDLDELKARLGIAPDVELIRAQRMWIDDFVFFLNRPGVVGLLFFVAIICVYLELHLMTGILGLISALCLILFFWSKWLGGTADSLEILLFLFGIVCVAMEIFVLPGAAIFGVTGVLSIAASLVMASQTFNLVDDGRNIEEATRTLGTLGVALLGVGAVAMVISRYLPQIPILKHMILTPPGAIALADPNRPQLRPEVAGTADPLLGRIGVARTLLRPSGKAEIDGRLVEVISEGGMVPAGKAVEVVQAQGARIVVREVAANG
ncbi:Serine dehydrogenase proteinase [Caulifigura coniformis]|uniref:Serine dehydrogenase proteinase n=1 Tax=Caulifigura coniformis TaxID=2527983 RepID=A0A517SL26_9PLAN|nr:NfeD family protein [Caulifigura coniformis]QDT56823.1 Serine dehydrogenase proteinase [Caulifigura coniformis]